jgi:hypothetical protein
MRISQFGVQVKLEAWVVLDFLVPKSERDEKIKLFRNQFFVAVNFKKIIFPIFFAKRDTYILRFLRVPRVA